LRQRKEREEEKKEKKRKGGSLRQRKEREKYTLDGVLDSTDVPPCKAVLLLNALMYCQTPFQC
jgi:hypothetical protein